MKYDKNLSSPLPLTQGPEVNTRLYNLNRSEVAVLTPEFPSKTDIVVKRRNEETW